MGVLDISDSCEKRSQKNSSGGRSCENLFTHAFQLSRRSCRIPAPGGGAKCCFMLRPVMQDGRIEVGPGSPHERLHLGVQFHSRKLSRIAQGAE
jgi:hypothetical protein